MMLFKAVMPIKTSITRWVYCASCKCKRHALFICKKMTVTNKLYSQYECLSCHKLTTRFEKVKK